MVPIWEWCLSFPTPLLSLPSLGGKVPSFPAPGGLEPNTLFPHSQLDTGPTLGPETGSSCPEAALRNQEWRGWSHNLEDLESRFFWGMAISWPAPPRQVYELGTEQGWECKERKTGENWREWHPHSGVGHLQLHPFPIFCCCLSPGNAGCSFPHGHTHVTGLKGRLLRSDCDCSMLMDWFKASSWREGFGNVAQGTETFPFPPPPSQLSAHPPMTGYIPLGKPNLSVGIVQVSPWKGKS